MVDQLNGFAAEVTRVAREVGAEGKLGGQADVKGVAGTWKDLTDNVNSMAGNLTGQVRNIADVTKAVALVCLGGNARGARGRQRRCTRRTGACGGCFRHLEGFDGQREFHGE